MAKRITPGQIRRTNRQQVFQYIYDEKKVSQQDIAYALQLSKLLRCCSVYIEQQERRFCRSFECYGSYGPA